MFDKLYDTIIELKISKSLEYQALLNSMKSKSSDLYGYKRFRWGRIIYVVNKITDLKAFKYI